MEHSTKPLIKIWDKDLFSLLWMFPPERKPALVAKHILCVRLCQGKPLNHQSTSVLCPVPQNSSPTAFSNLSLWGIISWDTCDTIWICDLASLVWPLALQTHHWIIGSSFAVRSQGDGEGEQPSIMLKYVPFPLWSAGPRRLLFVRLPRLHGWLHLRLKPHYMWQGSDKAGRAWNERRGRRRLAIKR